MSDSVRPHEAPPSLGFSRQEHWSGLPFPSPKEYILYDDYLYEVQKQEKLIYGLKGQNSGYLLNQGGSKGWEDLEISWKSE